MSKNLTLRPIAQPDGSVLYALEGAAPIGKVASSRRGDEAYEPLAKAASVAFNSCLRALIFLLQKPAPVCLGVPTGNPPAMEAFIISCIENPAPASLGLPAGGRTVAERSERYRRRRRHARLESL